MSKPVILVEEDSAKIILDELCQRFFPDAGFIVIPHNGKHALRKSIEKKLKTPWLPKTRFIILHDKDDDDCRQLKSKLLNLIPAAKHPNCKVRIVMSELETWYLSDLDALVESGLLTSKRKEQLQNDSKFRAIEKLENAKQEFYKLINVQTLQQRTLARKIAPYINPDRSSSTSFKLLRETLVWASAYE